MLSKRLQAILDLIDPCDTIVDVGTDHGYLIIQALLIKKCHKAYALDIASGPLEFAKANLIKYNLEDKIEIQKRDGLKGFNQQADVFVVAGMGSETIIEILKNHTFSESNIIIIQSNTKIVWLRTQLVALGFEFIEEVFLYDNKKPVIIIKVKIGNTSYTDQEYHLGPWLMYHPTIDYMAYLKHEYNKALRVVEYNDTYMHKVKYLKEYLQEKGVIDEKNN